uniref:C-type lectin n=1 Tax=Plectus sambesii TaxID=2011161 RepID=A0A914WWT0_9BILA
MKISGIVVLLLLLPSAMAVCNCTQGVKGLDLVLIVDVDSASLAKPFGGRNPLDYAKAFLTQLLFNNGMTISPDPVVGIRVAVFGVNATQAIPTKATLLSPSLPNNPTTVRNAINSLTPDGSDLPTVDIDAGFLAAENLFNKPDYGMRQNIPNVIITISSSTLSSAAIYDASVLQQRYGVTMISIAVNLAGPQLDYTNISSPHAAFTVNSLDPNGFDPLMNPILGLMCIAEGYCNSGNSTAFPPTTQPPRPPNQDAKCHNGSEAWPKLWLDVVLLIDKSAAQTKVNFDAMILQIEEIWATNSGGPIVSQATARTRVGVVAFDTQATVVADLTQLKTNDDLTNALNGITQTSATTVDGSNALQAAGSLFGQNVAGDRPNAPNVIIIYSADWAGNDACQISASILENTVVVAVKFKNRNQASPTIPSCVYSPGEIYDASNPNLDVTLLESLAFANCFCIGQNMPGNHGKSLQQKTSRVDHQVWYQLWLPQADNNYYLRDKWGECVLITPASSNHDTAAQACHDDGNFLPNEFNMIKHQFVMNIAATVQMISQWIGLQYDPVARQWFWDDFNRVTGQYAQRPANPGDYVYWNPNQPDTTGNKNCVRETPSLNGPGFKWSSVQCNGFQDQYHSRFLCQTIACDAFNYCSNY